MEFKELTKKLNIFKVKNNTEIFNTSNAKMRSSTDHNVSSIGSTRDTVTSSELGH